MLYQQYKSKIEKISRVLKKIFKYRVPIIIALSLITASVSVMLSLRGVVVAGEMAVNEVEYGENFDYTASALLSKNVSYEYREANGEWSDVKPTKAGEYEVRAVSKRTFGAKSYGDAIKFKIKAKPLTVKPLSDTIPYGDEPKLIGDLAYTDEIICDEFIYSDMYAMQTEVTPVLDSVKIINSKGEDVTDCYDIKTEGADITYSKRPVTIIAGSLEREYDGSPLTCHEYTVEGGLFKGQQIENVSFDEYSVIISAGSVKNEISGVQIVAPDGGDYSENYEITFVSGELSVTQRKITVESVGDEKEYDGTPLVKEGVSVIEGSVATGEKLIAKNYFDGAVDAITYRNIFDYSILGANGEDLTQNYSVTQVYGELKITKRPVAIKTADRTFIYNGYRQCVEINDENAYRYDGSKTLIEGHRFGYLPTYVLSVRDSGTENNAFTDLKVLSDSGEDKTSNYDLTVKNGNLTVTPRPVFISSASGEFVYDGTLHSLSGENGWRYSDETSYGFVSGHIFNYTSTSLQNAGGVQNEINDDYTVTFNGEVLTENYSIAIDNVGTLTVTKRAVTVTAKEATKVYDGTPLSCDMYDAECTNDYNSGDLNATGFVLNHYLFVTKLTAITNVNRVPNLFGDYTVVYEDGSTDETLNGNYTITISAAPGMLEITKRPVTIKSEDGEKIFDGAPLVRRGFECTSELNIVDGQEFIITESAAPIDVLRGGDYSVLSYDNTIEYTVRYNGSEYYNDGAINAKITDNYTFTIEFGKLTINPCSVKIKTESGEFVYDAKQHQYHNYKDGDIIDGSFVDTVEYGGSIYNLGHKFFVSASTVFEHVTRNADGNPIGVENEYFDYNVKNNAGEAVTYNYDITFEKGFVTVIPREISVRTDDKTWTYDGDEHSYGETTYNEEALIKTQYITPYGELPTIRYYSESGVENRFAVKILSKKTDYYDDGDDVTDNYNIALAYGTLKIDKRSLTLTADSIQIMYDGKRHVDDDLTYAEGGLGLVKTDVLTVKLTLIDEAGGLNVGTYGRNLEVVSIIDQFGVNVTECYETVCDGSTVEITPRPIKILTNTRSWTYDGTEHYDNGCTSPVQNDVYFGLAENQSAICDGDFVMVRYVWDTVTANNKFSVKILSGVTDFYPTDTDVTDNYSIEYEYGTLEITKRSITVTADSDEVEYDGQPHSCESFTPEGQNGVRGLVSTDEITAQTSGSGIDADDYDNAILYGSVIITEKNGGKDVTDCYEIECAMGVIKITPRRIAVKTGSGEWVYDGKVHYNRDEKTPDCDGYEVTRPEGLSDPAIVKGQTFVVVSSTEITDVYYKDGVVSGIDNEFTDWYIQSGKVENYDVTWVYGTLTVLPREVIVTAKGDSKVYDGKPLTCTRYDDYLYDDETKSYDVNIKGFVLGHKLNVTGYTSITNAGSIDNKFTEWQIVDEFGENILTEFYKPLASNYTIVGEDGEEITEITGGTLTVNKRHVIVTTQNGEWVYDGLPHYNDVVIAVCDNDDSGDKTGFVLNHKFVATTYTTIIDAGTVTNEITEWKLIDEDSLLDENALKENYEIEINNGGTLTVTPRRVRITTGSASKDYDGTPLTCIKYEDECTNDENSSIGFVLGHKLNNIYSSSITDVGTTPNEFYSWKIVDADGNERNARGYLIANNYIFVDENGDKITGLSGGTLEITKRTITVVFENLEFTYDGQPHSASENDIKSKAFSDGEPLPDRFTLVFSDFVAYTDAEVYEIKATVTVKENGIDVSDKYGVIIEGSITINPREVRVTTEDLTKEYDGTPLNNGNNAYSFESANGIRGLLSGHKAVIYPWNSITDYKDSGTTNGGKVFVEDNGKDVTNNYNFTFTGTLTITKRQITVTTNDYEFTFNGKDQSDCSTPTVDRLVSGHSFEVLTSSSVKYVWETSKNIIVAWQVLDGDENDVTDNYEIVGMNCGTLTVKPRTVTLKVKDAKLSYNGKPRIQSELEFTGEDVYILSGITIKALNDSLQTPQTKIGTYTIRFTGDSSKDIKFVEGATDITDCFIVEGVNDGTLTINLELVLRVRNLFVNYNDCDRITSDNYREKDGDYIVSYYDEDVGAYYGTISEQGYKEIASALSFDCDKHYDFKAEDYEAILYILRQHPEYLTVDKDGNVISDYTLTWSYDRDDKESFYQGYIRIYHELEITTGSAEKEYDGTPLTCDKTTFKSLSDCGEVTKDLFNIKATGSQTEVGYSRNTLVCELVQAALDQGFIPDCFKIVNSDRCEGTLMVYEVCGYITTATKQSVYLKTLSYKEYDEKTQIPADSYDSLIDGKYSYDYLTSYLLSEKGVKLNRARIRFKNGIAYPYALPIYLKPQDSELQTSDAKYTRKSSEEPIDEDGFTAPYMVDFYNFDYLSYTGQLAENPKFNDAYTSFVRNNYLGLTSSSKDLTELLNLIVKNLQLDGLTDKEKIEKIVEYVKGLAPYNYNHYKYQDNSVSEFFEGRYKNRGAVCRHYAAAATYLLRAAGFPARVTVGYRVNTKANVKTEIRSSYLHAWTEVYVDGVGWVSVDATASNGGIGGNGDGVSDEDGEIPDPNGGDNPGGGDEDPEEMDFFEKLKTLDVLVRPKDAKKVYDGDPLTASEFEFVRKLTREDGTVYYEVDDELTQFFEQFYITGYAEYGGEQKEVGESVSTITSFKLIYEGEDVIVSKDGSQKLVYGDILYEDMFKSFELADGVLTVLKPEVKDSTFVINLRATIGTEYDGTYKSIVGKPISIKLKAAPIGVDSASVKIFTDFDKFNAYMANNSGGFAIYVPIADLKVKNVGETPNFKSLGVKIYKYDENYGWVDMRNSYAVVFTDNKFENAERKDIIDFIAENAPTGYGEVGSVYEKELITVNKATITFVFLDETIKFDGEQHSPENFVVYGLPNGYRIEYLKGAFEEFNMVGAYVSEINEQYVTIYDAEGRNVTNNFEVVCKTGTFTIE